MHQTTVTLEKKTVALMLPLSHMATLISGTGFYRSEAISVNTLKKKINEINFH